MKKIIIIIFMLALTVPVFAQKKPPPEPAKEINTTQTGNSGFIGFGLDLMLPRGESATKNDELGFGFDINGGYQFDGIPIIVGGEMLYGQFTGGYDGTAYYDDDSDETFDISTESNVLSLMAYVRFQSDGEYFQPYIEALGGFKILWTGTEFDYSDFWDDEDDTEINIDFGDFVWSYGIGFGFLIPIVESDKGKEGIFLDFNFKYLFGGEAEFLEGHKFIGDYGNYSLVTKKSRSDSYILRLGIGFRM